MGNYFHFIDEKTKSWRIEKNFQITELNILETICEHGGSNAILKLLFLHFVRRHFGEHPNAKLKEIILKNII